MTSSTGTESMARVSHDLRGPLQTILGFAELLSLEMSGPLNAEQRQYVAFIQRDAMHMLDLINRMAD